MKKYLLVYLALLPFVSFAQIKGDITIEWLEKTEMSFGDSKINIPQFTGNTYDYNVSEKSLFYTISILESNIFDGSSVKITNVVYEPVVVEQLGDLNIKSIPRTPSASLIVKQSRDLKQAFLKLSPIVKDEFGFKRIKSFTYSVSSANSRIS